MAGVLMHFAAGSPDVLGITKKDREDDVKQDIKYTPSYRKAYAIGLILPDLAKNNIINTKADFDRFFEGCEEKDILTWEEFLRFKEKNHFCCNKDNPSLQDPDNPDLVAFLKADFVKMERAVWKGVFCHLFFDKGFYRNDLCTRKKEAKEDWTNSGHNLEDWYITKEWRESEIAIEWYGGYDAINGNLEETYGVTKKMEAILSPDLFDEIKERFHVSFKSGTPKYFNSDRINRYVAYGRLFAREVDSGNINSILRIFEPQEREIPDKTLEEVKDDDLVL